LIPGQAKELLEGLNVLNERSPRWARNPILAGFRGSHAHGTYLPPDDPHGTDDVDVFGVIVHPPAYYLGLDGFKHKHDTFNSNEEHLDIETHEVRKFVRLLEKGNPNVHQHLWLEAGDYLVITRPGRILLNRRSDFLSQRMFESFGGYAYAQLKRMTKLEKRGYMGQKREAIIREYGYDIKNAAHCIRLLYGAIHLARHNEIQVRLTDPALTMVLDIKRGKWSLEAVESHAKRLFRTFDGEKSVSRLPLRPDDARMSQTLRDVIEAQWEDLRQW
jgi:predicted nucleotidyltransferase